MFDFIKRALSSIVDKPAEGESLRATYAEMTYERLRRIKESELTPEARTIWAAEMQRRNLIRQ